MERLFASRKNAYAKVMGAITVLGIVGLTAAFFIPDPPARCDLTEYFSAVVFFALICVFRSLGAQRGLISSRQFSLRQVEDRHWSR